jgi:hypothetical protein
MTTVTRQFRQNPLTKLVLGHGGLTKAAAVTAADANLETIHDECVAEVDRDFDLLRRSAAAPDIKSAVGTQREIYAHANSIAGIAGCCGLGEMGEAAFSLCELVDRQIAAGAWNDDAVSVHINAMSLLRGLDVSLTTENSRSMLDGLRSVALSAPLGPATETSPRR